MERIASAACVSGEKLAMNLTQCGIPSSGQIIPLSNKAGKMDPIATCITSVSSLEPADMAKP